jgi:hypothetical protein
MRKLVLFFLFFTGFSSSLQLNAQSLSLRDCKVELKNNILTVENNKVKQTFKWNSGQLIPLELKDKNSVEDTFVLPQEETDLRLNSTKATAQNDTLSITVERLSPLDPEFLRATIMFNLNDLNIKRTIDIFPNTSAVTHTFYLKGKTTTGSTRAKKHQTLSMIESNEQTDDFLPTIGNIALENPHWQFEVIHFKEATDYHNTLTHAYKISAYSKAEIVSGNLLIATNSLKNQGFFIIKESPLGESQSNYLFKDFKLSRNEVSVLGLGIPEDHIFENQWTKGYGYTIGVGTSKKNTLLFHAKTYQKQKRALLKDRDEMILANTWGDRSKDSRMNEAFIREEIQAGKRLGITHLQLDDGWQQGLSKNSASTQGKQWDDWHKSDWQPHNERFPNGFENIIKTANASGIEICLWFNPSKKNNYENWERDADILIDFYNTYGIKVFKIDGIELTGKTAELNLRKFFNKVQKATEGKVVFNLDVTAGRRMGYFYFLEYGNLFMENRYTDWGNYYPHHTLRNLWMLSKYIPAEKIQVEFLNKWRNTNKYQQNDPLAPLNIPFEYQVASTFAGQPLAWTEVSQLPKQAFGIQDLLKSYKKIQHDFHTGLIMPIGQEPNGLNWSGFQSVGDKKGYVLIFRAYSDHVNKKIKTHLPASTSVVFKAAFGDGKSFEAKTDKEGFIEFSLPEPFSFGMYSYEVLD